ncbi:MAG: hypothetical protein QOI54_3389 [Actinomycetota bacterium]|jgi:hypothetical protein|nr:hypothetical protein [Actinomycetota bacterium]
MDWCLGNYCLGFHPSDAIKPIVNIGRGASFGLSDKIANWISPGASCTVGQDTLDKALGSAATIVATLGWGSTAAGEEADLVSGWRGTNMTDQESFDYHYAEHGGGVTREQYAQDARDWASNPTGNGTSVPLKDGTTGVRYRTPGGGPGGILDSDGNIVTFWYR